MAGVLVLVGLGFGIPGAIVGTLAASVVELAIARRYVRPPLVGRPLAPAGMLLRAGLPLALFDLGMRAFDKVDLFCLMALTGSSALAGFYGAAQNLSLAPGMFALSFSPLLLSTLTRTVRSDGEAVARPVAVEALRVAVGLVPFAAMAAGASGEITVLLLGESFLPAAPLFAVLVFGALGLVWLSVGAAVLTAAGKPWWTVAIAGPLVALALAGHLVLIPRYGALGAAAVSTGLALLGGIAAFGAVHRVWSIVPPRAAVLRAAALAGGAWALASLLPEDDLYDRLATLRLTSRFIRAEITARPTSTQVTEQLRNEKIGGVIFGIGQAAVQIPIYVGENAQFAGYYKFRDGTEAFSGYDEESLLRDFAQGGTRSRCSGRTDRAGCAR